MCFNSFTYYLILILYYRLKYVRRYQKWLIFSLFSLKFLTRTFLLFLSSNDIIFITFFFPFIPCCQYCFLSLFYFTLYQEHLSISISDWILHILFKSHIISSNIIDMIYSVFLFLMYFQIISNAATNLPGN